jgi:hypothetical protein
LSFDPATALLRAVNILDIPHSKRLASGPNYGAIFGQIFFSEALKTMLSPQNTTNRGDGKMFFDLVGAFFGYVPLNKLFSYKNKSLNTTIFSFLKK